MSEHTLLPVSYLCIVTYSQGYHVILHIFGYRWCCWSYRCLRLLPHFRKLVIHIRWCADMCDIHILAWTGLFWLFWEWFECFLCVMEIRAMRKLKHTIGKWENSSSLPVFSNSAFLALTFFRSCQSSYTKYFNIFLLVILDDFHFIHLPVLQKTYCSTPLQRHPYIQSSCHLAHPSYYPYH